MLESLSALSALESEATGRQKREAEEKSRQRDHQSQLQKIKQLKQRRDELLQMLHDRTDSEAGVAESSHRSKKRRVEEGEEADELTSALAYVTELKEKLQVYKMTGVSVVKTDQDSKVLCFTTSYKGIYLESYHLKVQRLASGNFKVVHHDLPPFIMYSTLPDSLEVKDMLSAVRPVQEALAMFVLRREELKGAQGEFSDSLHIVESSTALDYLCCRMDINDDFQVEITLKYANLNHYLPSTVKAVLLKRDGRRIMESLPPDIMDSLHSNFCSHRLCVALSQTAQLLRSDLHTHHQHSPENQ